MVRGEPSAASTGVTHDGRAARLGRREWSPIVGAEHLATRERAALFDITPFAKFRVGAGALAFLERICANRIDRPGRHLVYTSMLTPRGGIRCDLTVTRLDEHLFQVVTGGGSAMHDLAWLRAQVRDGERVGSSTVRARSFCLGLWGPRARDILQRVTRRRRLQRGFPYMTGALIDVGEVPVFAQRISYVGELGWELYGPMEMGERLWDLLWDAGRDTGSSPPGWGRSTRSVSRRATGCGART